MASDADEELHSMMKSIVDELEAAVAGNLYRSRVGRNQVPRRSTEKGIA